MDAIVKYCTEEKQLPFERALDNLVLSPLNKQIIQERYVELVKTLHRQTMRTSLLFHVSRTMITVGSLIVPALLSIQYTNSAKSSLEIYWTTWTISLLVTVCNGLQTLFKLDKHYYHLHTVKEQLISDGWQYLECTGKYSGFYTPKEKPTHENQFVYFCHSIEKIRMMQIQEEYYKVADGNHGHGMPTSSVGQDSTKTTGQIVAPNAGFLPPTPLHGELGVLTPEGRKILEQLSQNLVGDGVQNGADTKVQTAAVAARARAATGAATGAATAATAATTTIQITEGNQDGANKSMSM